MKTKRYQQLLDAVETVAPYGRKIPALQQRQFRIACIDLGEYLQRWRERAGLTGTAVAAHLGITLSHLRDMEKGNRRYLPIHIRVLMKHPKIKRAA